jgi:hypothetical protein
MKISIFLTLFLGMGLFSSPIKAQNIVVQRNNVTEWSYTSAKSYSNPFRDVVLDLLVTTPSGRQMKIPGFWAGDNEWRFRFSSPELGSHTFTTVCNDTRNRNLHNQRGVINVTEYTGTNPLFKHGPLKISDNKRHFVHEDGTPFFWLADQWWHGMTTRFKWPEDFHTLTADRKEKGFSVIGFALGFPCDIAPFDPRGQNEAGDPWMDSTFTSINPAYFDLTDLRVNYLVSQGLVPSVMPSWGYYIKFAGMENMKEHYRYVIARYGAYPITWILAGEVTLAYYTDLANNWDYYKEQFREQWSEMGRYLQATDPFDRLVTVHPGPGIWDGKPPLNDMDVVDFIFLQSGHRGFHTLPRAVEQVVENMELYPDRPVLHGEVCFEGMFGSSWNDVQRFLFWSNMMMGTAGFSYGVEGIWEFNTNEQLFGPPPGGLTTWGNVPWERAYQYPGSTHVGMGKQIMERFEWWRFVPRQDWIRDSDPQKFYQPYSAGISGEIRMIYVYQPISGSYATDLVPGKTYNYRYIDPMCGHEYPIVQFTADETGSWHIGMFPEKKDLVLVIYEN